MRCVAGRGQYGKATAVVMGVPVVMGCECVFSKNGHGDEFSMGMMEAVCSFA